MTADHDRRWAWLVGLVAAVLVVGPGLGPGAWLNLDLVVTDVTPVPRGVWGLGPELPRRVPFALPFAWLSAAWPSELPWKLAAVAALASCTAGTWRLVVRWSPGSSVAARAGAALVVGVGPFATTRLGAGHLGMTFALGLLPWALPWLLRPADRPARTVGWALALAATGPFGGTLALPALACGVVGSRAWRAPGRGRAALAVAGACVAQGVWLVPTLVVAAQGTDIASAGEFPTDLGGVGGPLRLVVGHGFWRPLSQVGGAQGVELAVAALVVLAAAVVGLRHLPDEVRAPASLVAGLGLVVAAVSGVEALDGAVGWLVDLPAGAALREGQRLLALWLVVAAPAAAIGVERLAARAGEGLAAVVLAVPLALAVVLAGPALWGIGGALDPVGLPAGWSTVREEVHASPGTVMALPWRSYPQPVVADGRSVSQPMAIYLGGDVLASSDPGFGDGSRERADAREPLARDLAERMAAGEAVADDLAALGVRWVVDVPVVDDRAPHLDPDDPGLRAVHVDADIALYEVVAWAPAIRTDDDAPVEVDRPLAPVIRTDDAEVRVAAPGSTGWRRSGDASGVDAGQLLLPAGAGTAWYPGTLAVGVADALALGMAIALVARRRRAQRRAVPADGGAPRAAGAAGAGG